MGLGDLVELVYLVAGEADEGGASGDGARSLCQRVDAGQAATSNTPIRPTPPGSWKDQDSHYRAELAKRTTRSTEEGKWLGVPCFRGPVPARIFPSRQRAAKTCHPTRPLSLFRGPISFITCRLFPPRSPGGAGESRP